MRALCLVGFVYQDKTTNPKALMKQATSLFAQLLTHFPRTEFQSLVKRFGAERYAKGFSCWTQFVSMLFCQLARAESLREICYGLECCLGKLNHLGIDRSPKRSTLSYANEHRPAKFYEALFFAALNRFRSQNVLGPRQRQFRFKNRLLLLDSTVISLCLSLFPWAGFRRRKGAVKLHVVLDHADLMPEFVTITEGKRHEIPVMKQTMRFTKGSIIVADKGYIDYDSFGRWTEQGVYFVTRLKEDATYDLIERKAPTGAGVRADLVIRINGPFVKDKCPYDLRVVKFWDEESQREFTFVTNHHGLAAATIAAVYKERWKIETFFRTIKQTLHIKSFVGTTENALRVQIWTALIAMLLLRWMHHLSKAHWNLSVLAAMLRMNLFTYRDLVAWLDHPFGTPPIGPWADQLAFDLGQQGATS